MTPSWPYLHTLINHFPIILTVVGTLALLLALMRPRRGVWLYSLASLTLAGVLAYPAAFSGEKAAHMVHNAWYIAPGAVRTHAQAADVTLWILLVMGVCALIAWVSIAREREAFAPARWLRIAVSVVAVIATLAVSYTAFRGGQIVVDSPILASPTPPALQPQTVPAAIPQTGGTPPQITQPGVTQPMQPQPMQPQPTQQATPQQPASH